MVPWSLPATTTNRLNSNNKDLGGKVTSPLPIVVSSNICSNGPESPPVLFDPDNSHNHNRTKKFNSCMRNIENDNIERCRSCQSTALITDWSQGDRVCTSCGVVAEDRLIDDRPEWKDFNEAEDIVKGLPSKSRSGLVAVDETKYVGGLQPTILSKDAFGENSGGYKMTKIRRQLKATNKRLDHMMEKVHKRALQDAKIERRVKLKREADSNINGMKSCIRDSYYDSQSEVRPEFDLVLLQEEDGADKLHTAVHAEKWSLDRAIFLYGTSDDLSSLTQSCIYMSREDLLSQMNRALRDASRDLYTAYKIITQAARSLRLPDRVMNEVIYRIVRYATRRDGFSVKGISTRLPNRKGRETKEGRKEALMKLREYNKIKQMSSLGAAMLFLTARTRGWVRTIKEICDCFQQSLECSNEKVYIKPKHCSCAMNEIKSYFPEYTRLPTDLGSNSFLNDGKSVSNFADFFIRNLELPPVAEACIRTLLVYLKQEQIELGINSGVKMSSLCATITYFVCTAGAAMQKLAHQVNLKTLANHTCKLDSLQRQHPLRGSEGLPTNTKCMEISQEDKRRVDLSTNPLDSFRDSEVIANDDSNNDDSDCEPFDVFTHSAVLENPPEKLEYDMRRMWDAWSEQMTWTRSLHEIEQSCNISSTVILNLYKSAIYPRRQTLLDVLKTAATTKQDLTSEYVDTSDSSLRQTPLASILLARISIAAELMNSK